MTKLNNWLLMRVPPWPHRFAINAGSVALNIILIAWGAGTFQTWPIIVGGLLFMLNGSLALVNFNERPIKPRGGRVMSREDKCEVIRFVVATFIICFFASWWPLIIWYVFNIALTTIELFTRPENPAKN